MRLRVKDFRTLKLVLFLPLRALAITLALAGCSSTPVSELTLADLDVVARDQRYALVRMQPGHQLADLARIFLGSPLESWQIAEANPTLTGETGEVVAVPLTPLNGSSVYSDGYRVLPVLCYHQFTRAEQIEHRLELRASDFEAQLRYLIDNNYQLLSFADLEQILRQDRPIPPRAVVLTIDDGYASVYEVAWPILKKYNAPATLFIYTDFVGAGAALNWQELSEMAASGLIEVESHAKSHSSLARGADDKSRDSYLTRLRSEFEGSEKVFKKRLDAPPKYLSYPYGNSSVEAERMLEARGYGLAATVTRGDNTSFTNPYLVHRTMIYGDHSLDDFARLLRTFREKSLK